ncbi:hypothetical protein QBC33DRAFT_373622 [Phialemonium atrogriseum]|uniref:Uncharacterized protein n=1 Tax=Phialemonium atrogriseum TaxID=1093897 RepID=A0AAJ0FMY4_9PEZI|nr:uncharacterized protein QBC33DRAFT_373622 [Phialemonium atrogriseum]KAK1768359.1 hypothetical protein QBC33DRAFT_373622 [Phialemonium atrogriseum]
MLRFSPSLVARPFSIVRIVKDNSNSWPIVGQLRPPMSFTITINPSTAEKETGFEVSLNVDETSSVTIKPSTTAGRDSGVEVLVKAEKSFTITINASSAEVVDSPPAQPTGLSSHPTPPSDTSLGGASPTGRRGRSLSVDSSDGGRPEKRARLAADEDELASEDSRPDKDRALWEHTGARRIRWGKWPTASVLPGESPRAHERRLDWEYSACREAESRYYHWHVAQTELLVPSDEQLGALEAESEDEGAYGMASRPASEGGSWVG